jgi:hypothetical protein
MSRSGYNENADLIARLLDAQMIPGCGCEPCTMLRNAAVALAAQDKIITQIQPPNDIGDNCTAELAVKCADLESKVAAQDKIVAVMREALQITAGEQQCLDNLMSHVEVACAALALTRENQNDPGHHHRHGSSQD